MAKDMTKDFDYSSEGETKLRFLGKIASIGPGGCGKTYMIMQLTNFIHQQKQYSWDEEAQMAGTTGIIPYSIKMPQIGKAIINDNPGQTSMQVVREAIAKTGDVYQGMIIMADALCWNFRNIGVMHAENIHQYNKDRKNLPVVIIINKRDIIQILNQWDQLKTIADVIAKTVSNIQPNQEIPFTNRIFRKPGRFKLQASKKKIQFIALEQILVNALDNHLQLHPVIGFSKMNIRLFTRAFLMGYCELVKGVIDTSLHPEYEAIDDNLMNLLNYHRPTAYETGTPWKQLVISNPKPEPPIFLNLLTPDNVLNVIKAFVIASEAKIKHFFDNVTKKGHKHGWKIVDHCYADSMTTKGLQKISKTISALFKEMKRQQERKEAKTDNLSVQELNLDDF